MKSSHTMNSGMVYLVHDPRRSNSNNFINNKVVSWYINFLGSLHLHMIFIWVMQVILGMVCLGCTIVKRAYTMHFGYGLP